LGYRKNVKHNSKVQCKNKKESVEKWWTKVEYGKQRTSKTSQIEKKNFV